MLTFLQYTPISPRCDVWQCLRDLAPTLWHSLLLAHFCSSSHCLECSSQHPESHHSQQPLYSPLEKSCSDWTSFSQRDVIHLIECNLGKVLALSVTHSQITSSVCVDWPPCGITHVFPADYKAKSGFFLGFVSKIIFTGRFHWFHCCHSLCSSHWTCLLKEWRWLVSFSSWPSTQYYQHSGDSTQDIRNGDLKMKYLYRLT